MTTTFHKASKAQSRARIALMGPAGSGKTYSALALATALGQRVALIDTERGSASKYADLFSFDVLELEEFDPRNYIAAIEAAQAEGYDVLVVDSLSHAWSGKGGVLEIKDAATARSRSGDSFGSGWREASPLHNRLVDAMLQCRLHLIATMRTKTEYAVTKEGGQTKIEKLGLAPVQRDGLEYEFDIVGDMDLDNRLVVSKTRCPALHGVVIVRPDAKLAEVISAWLTDGVPVPSSPGPVQVTRPPAGPGAATRMREAQDEATRTRQRADTATLPTPDQIQALKDPGMARAIYGRAPERYRIACERLTAEEWEDWRVFYKRASITQWQAILTDALEWLQTSGAAPVVPPAAEAAPDDPTGGDAADGD